MSQFHNGKIAEGKAPWPVVDVIIMVGEASSSSDCDIETKYQINAIDEDAVSLAHLVEVADILNSGLEVTPPGFSADVLCDILSAARLTCIQDIQSSVIVIGDIDISDVFANSSDSSTAIDVLRSISRTVLRLSVDHQDLCMKESFVGA